MGKLGAVIVAAGTGTRMGTKESKQFLPLQNKPVLIYTLEVFQQLPEVETIVLVTGEQDLVRCCDYINRYALHKVKSVISGGRERQHSVYQGLLALASFDVEWVLVHDGVRPFVSAEKIRQCWNKAMESGAAVLAVPVKDTIKVVDGAGEIRSTPDRKSLWAIQTPQAFRLAELRKAHEQAATDGYIGTDDAALIERLGQSVHVVEGDYSNVKLTTPEDLKWAEYRLLTEGPFIRNAKEEESVRSMIRVGQGFDVHQLVEGRPCIIGGVTIPFEKGLLGHSDADVLLHAISDAILGALGQGDIGKHFPDTSDEFKNADSLLLLKKVWEIAKAKGYRLGNLDATIIAERPKIAPHIPAIIEILAAALESETEQINIKATTSEKLGFTGREEGIAAQSVVCLWTDVL